MTRSVGGEGPLDQGGSGLVCAMPSMTTVGTVSLPLLTLATYARPASSSQMLTQAILSRSLRTAIRNRLLYGHPGRQ